MAIYIRILYAEVAAPWPGGTVDSDKYMVELAIRTDREGRDERSGPNTSLSQVVPLSNV
jgi:hypothetical protein